MLFFLGFSLIFFIISSVFLTLFVLFQNDQGEGLGGLFSGSSNSPFGAAGVNVVQKITGMLGALFFISAAAYNFSNRFHYGINKDLQEVTKNLKQAPNKEGKDNHSWWEKSDTKDLNLKSDTKDPNLKSDTKDPNLKSDTKDPNLKSDTKDPNLKSDTKDPNLKSDTKDPNLKSDTKDPNLKSDTKDPNLKSDTKDPNLKNIKKISKYSSTKEDNL